MGTEDNFYRPITTKKLISLLERNGFVNDKGTKHGKYVRDGDDHKVMVPRHKKITSGLSQQICKELIEMHKINESEVRKLF